MRWGGRPKNGLAAAAAAAAAAAGDILCAAAEEALAFGEGEPAGPCEDEVVLELDLGRSPFCLGEVCLANEAGEWDLIFPPPL